MSAYFSVHNVTREPVYVNGGVIPPQTELKLTEISMSVALAAEKGWLVITDISTTDAAAAAVEASRIAAQSAIAEDVAAVDTARNTAITVTIPEKVAAVDAAVAATYVGQAGASASAAATSAALAEAAKNFGFANAKGATTIADARALVADTETFVVYTPGAVTFSAYRRTSSTTEAFLGEYVSGNILLNGYTRSGWASTLTDDANNVAVGVRPDGSFAIGLEEDVGAAIPGARLATANFYDKPNGDGHVFGIVDDEENLAFVILADGRVVVGGLEAANKPQQDLLSAAVFGSRFITCWGNSETEGAGSTEGQTYPDQLAVLTGVPVINEGFGGQVTRQIVCRQGGAATLVTAAGNLIPASGSVSVTVDVNLLAHPSAQSFSITGTLLGVLGTLTKDTGNAYTFTRSTAGTAVICPPLTPFAVTKSTRNTSARNMDQGINIFWCGTNDVATDSISGVAGYIDLAVAKLQQSERRFLVLGPVASNLVTSSSGSYAPMRAEVAKLRAKYPRNFIDIHEILIENYNPAIPQDVTDYANRVTPSSLRSDAIHLNNAGYAIVANTIFNHIKSKGWL